MATATLPQQEICEGLQETLADFERQFSASRNLKNDIEAVIAKMRDGIDRLAHQNEQPLASSCLRLVEQILEAPDVELRSKLDMLARRLATYEESGNDFEAVASRLIKIH